MTESEESRLLAISLVRLRETSAAIRALEIKIELLEAKSDEILDLLRRQMTTRVIEPSRPIIKVNRPGTSD
jgi:hypothetical protein